MGDDKALCAQVSGDVAVVDYPHCRKFRGEPGGNGTAAGTACLHIELHNRVVTLVLGDGSGVHSVPCDFITVYPVVVHCRGLVGAVAGTVVPPVTDVDRA